MARVATGPGSRPATSRGTVTSEYRNPFRSAAVSPERIDQGVDYAGRAGDPIYAIGPAKVVEVINYGGNSGWPDGSGVGTSGGWVSYQLSSGPLMGQIVYVTEGVQPAVRAGQRIDSSTVVGHFAGGGGIETGWAGPPSQGDQTLAYAQGQSDFSGGDIGGWTTEAGATFSNLMASLGAPAGVPQAGGVHGGGGQLVSLAVSQTSPGGAGGSSGSGQDCLVGIPTPNLSMLNPLNLLGFGSVQSTQLCLLSRGAVRGAAGVGLLLLGGGVLLVATLMLAKYGDRRPGQGGPGAGAGAAEGRARRVASGP